MPSSPHLGTPVNEVWNTMVQNPRHPLYQREQQEQQIPYVINNFAAPSAPPAENRTDVILIVLGICFFVCALLMVIVVAFLHSQTMTVINSQQSLLMYMFQAQCAASAQQQYMWQMMMHMNRGK
jgi:hypothetical protein